MVVGLSSRCQPMAGEVVDLLDREAEQSRDEGMVGGAV